MTVIQLVVKNEPQSFTEMMQDVVTAINKWQRQLVENSIEYGLSDDKRFVFSSTNGKWSDGIKNVYTCNFKTFVIELKVNDEDLTLYVTENHSPTYNELQYCTEFSITDGNMADDLMHVIATAVFEYGKVLFTPNLSEIPLREIQPPDTFFRVNKDNYELLLRANYEELPNQNGGDDDYIIADYINRQFVFVENGCEHFTEDAIAKLNRPWFKRTALKSYCKKKFPFINYK